MPAAAASARCTSSLLTPTRNAAADQLDEQEAARRVELVPVAGDARGLLGRRQAAQRQQALLDPLGEGQVGRLPRPRGSTSAMVSARSPTAW